MISIQPKETIKPTDFKRLEMKHLIFIFSFLFSLHLYAKDGNLLYVRGDVSIDGKKATKGASISYGQKVKAGLKSLAVVSMKDGSKLKINQNSEIELKGIKKTKVKTSIVKLLKGNIFVKFKKTKAKGFKLQADNVAMGVRGTEFFASLGKKGKKDVWMCVNEGKVAVAKKGQKKAVLVKEGQGIVAPEEGEISEPKPLPWTKKLNWKMEGEDLENTVSIEEAYENPLDLDYE